MDNEGLWVLIKYERTQQGWTQCSLEMNIHEFYRKNLHFINILNYKGRSTNTHLCACVFSLHFPSKW